MLAKIKKSLLCISTISCMSLYAAVTVTNPITIGSTPSVPTETDYNYWSTTKGNTYVFNRSSNNNDTYWIANNTVTINKDYKLKLITNYTDCYYRVLDCWNTFINNGNVIIDNYGVLVLYNNISNNGTIDIINGALGLLDSATLNNKGTITLKDSSYIYINNSTLTNTGTIDISNITNLSSWCNNNIFILEGGSTFKLPKSIPTKKIGSDDYTFNDITLNGTKDNPVNIVIPEDCKYITDIDINNKEDLFYAIKEETGFTFNGNKDNVKFSWQKEYITVDNHITIGNYKGSNTKAAEDLSNTDYNYWSTTEDNTYVFNRDKDNNNDTYWYTNKPVTIDNGYTLKLITNYNDGYDFVLSCWNTFTNYGNVIIDNYGGLAIDYCYTTRSNTIGTSINNGAIDINNGWLELSEDAKLNNTGTITFKGSSFIYIYCSTLTNTDTIDISNITDLSYWGNYGTFTLEGGSTFILPKSITNKIKTYWWINHITLNGTKEKPVNIVIPKGCKYINDIDNNNKKALFDTIQDKTGFTFDGERDNVNFSWQTEDHINQPIEARQDNEYESVDEC